MVQRKVPNKLGIQADYVKSEKKLFSNLKTPSFQHQDNRSRGADLKKKMKKSGSFKHPETEHLLSSNMKRQIKQPGKPPPENNSATPRKLSPIKGVMATSPNYMKSTTSSDARKDRGLQVSSRSPQSSSDCKSSIRKNSLNSNRKPSSNSATKAVVRNLTKAPSFKPIRTSAKKCSQMMLCEKLKVQRETCSSIIKDHKFPVYLTLSPGATEAEGTSSMKVCPYTYCSLNGHHHHDALPPLKSFMLVKRRILKAQRNIKLECLSPRRKKPIQETTEEAEVQQFDSHEHPPSGNSSLCQEEHGEYFIEIYSKEKEDLLRNKHNIADCSVSDIKVSVDVQDEFAPDNRKDQQNSSDNSLESFPEKNYNIGDSEKVYTPKSTQDKIELDFLDFLYEMEVENPPSMQSEDTDSESDYVDWEAELYIGGSHHGGGKSIKINDMIDLGKANSLLDDALFLDDFGEVCDESFTSEIMQESIDNEIAYEAWSGDDDPEFISSHQNIWLRDGIINDDQNHNRFGTDELVDNLDGMFTVDSASLGIDGHGVGMINGAQSDDAFVPKMNQETEDCYDMGSQAFEKPHSLSEIPIEKLTNSIGTQTEHENEYQSYMSWKLDEVHKRSIGTQTDFEDDNKKNTCFQIDQLASGNMNEEEGKQSIDGIDNITLLQNCDEDAHQIVAGESVRDNGSFADEDNENKYGSITGIAESAHPGINKTQEASGRENSKKHVGACPPEEITKLNRIIKGNKRVIGQNEEQMEFNPRAPNFLPVEPEPDSEKVDLRHLTLDEKKNTDEWMVDYALQQTLTKLETARKRKVALLVQAFETVTPTSNESRAKLSSTVFSRGERVLARS